MTIKYQHLCLREVFEALYRNYNKRITNVLKTACDEHIPIGETMLQIMQRVEDEGEV